MTWFLQKSTTSPLRILRDLHKPDIDVGVTIHEELAGDYKDRLFFCTVHNSKQLIDFLGFSTYLTYFVATPVAHQLFPQAHQPFSV